MMALVGLLLSGTLLCILILTLVWWRQLYTQNAGIVDAWWAYNFGLLMVCYLILTPVPVWPLFVPAGCVVLWSLRLGTHLLQRNAGHAVEDERYRKLREAYGTRSKFLMWRFFMYQGISNVLLSFPFALMAISETHQTEWTLIGTAIWLVGFIGESIADKQLRSFKQKPENNNLICQKGLWAYSRHPNYFFEWLIWVAYAVMALSVPWGWTAMLCPLIMYALLRYVTGIPMLEQLAIQKRGDAYLDYQRRVNAFFPWYAKRK